MRRGEIVRSAILLAAGWTLGNYSRLAVHHEPPIGLARHPPPPPQPPEGAPRRREYGNATLPGVAATVVGPRGRPALIAAQLAIVSAALPSTWIGVDVYYRPGEAATPAVRALRRAADLRDRVTAVALAAPLDALPQRSLLLRAEFWRRMRAPRILWFEAGAAVLCASAPLSLDAPLFAPYDWVGAPWLWAKAGTPHASGGNGALSLRSRDAIVALFDDAGVEPRDKGNEDMWFVKALAAAGELPSLGGRAARLAPRAVSARFAVEEGYDRDATGDAPVGVYHLMRTMPYANRSTLLDRCPEARILFRANHDPRCEIACPRDRTLLERPLRVWKAACPADAAACALTPGAK